MGKMTSHSRKKLIFPYLTILRKTKHVGRYRTGQTFMHCHGPEEVGSVVRSRGFARRTLVCRNVNYTIARTRSGASVRVTV